MNDLPTTPDLVSLCAELERLAAEQSEEEWPEPRLRALADAGVLGWVIPTEWGGSDVSAAELTFGYERLAAADLLATFILTQRNGACQRIAGSENETLKSELLPRLSRGEIFATVGISHLTTSRQHLSRPAVEARPVDGGFVLNGSVPWVTGAVRAQYVVTGGSCDDGRQILIAVPTDLPGVRCDAPTPLLALNGSLTGSVRLDNLVVSSEWLIAGPEPQIMKRGHGGGAGSLTTSALAVGAAASALRRLHAESATRPDLPEIHDSLAAERVALLEDMRAALDPDPAARGPGQSAESIRHRANSLVLRATQALLAASKGAGFVRGHPAERAVREAMFFLVWSCPQPVLQATLRELACVVGD